MSVLEFAIRASADPLAADLVARLRQGAGAPPRAKATRPFSRRAALQIYGRKAAKGDRPTVRTDGYPVLLAALGAAAEGEVIVHGVTFADTVYLVFTDPTRERCLGVLRKVRLARSGGGTRPSAGGGTEDDQPMAAPRAAWPPRGDPHGS